MANKSQYLVFTRFYKGEAECPDRLKSRNNGEYLWGIERDWVSESLNNSLSDEFVEDYIRYVDPKVDAELGIPVSLLAYIFHRTSKWKYSIADWGRNFTSFIKEEYIH